MNIEKHHEIVARGISAKQIAKTALECGFRDFDASQKKYRKASVHQGFQTFYIGSKTACRGFKSFCPCQNKDDHPHGWSFLFSLGILKDLNPKWACTVKKNSPGDCFLGARCEDGYQNQQDFGRQAVQIRLKTDLRPSAPAKIQDITFRGVLFLLCQKPL